jgi:Rieske Fe-S protein
VNRREFIRVCTAGAAATHAVAALADIDAKPKRYGRVLLVDESGAPLRAGTLVANRPYIFHYPFAATPCFLLDLGHAVRASAPLRTADARSYRWEGGVGPRQSIVAYSAICSHQLTHPTRDISFIGYREERTAHSPHAKVIHCCSEHSQYDPAAGARVLAGPAPQPLAAVLLEYDRAGGGLHAIGTLGGEVFDEFFAKFEFKLALEHDGKPRAAVDGRAVVRELTKYCRQQVKC